MKDSNDNISAPDFRDMDDLDSAPVKTRARPQPLSPQEARNFNIVGGARSETPGAKGASYTETCKVCQGSGRFTSYIGRDVGPCFKCAGKGKRTYKTSPAARAASRASRVKAKNNEAQRFQEWGDTWLEDNPERAAFLEQDWEFPRSLMEGLRKYGRLTEGQIAAIDKCLKTQAERAAKRQGAEQTGGPGLDLTDLPAGYYAVPGGDTRLKLRISRSHGGKWDGWTFVDNGAEYGDREKYGAQRPGGLYQGPVAKALARILDDPFEASKAYGRLVGVCGVCGRRLEDAASVAAGIGPICAKKF